ncbi:MAG TPA: hypothetical protein VF594_08325 [Rubricoccaceae bacterium]|jgi:hypothetical protein
MSRLTLAALLLTLLAGCDSGGDDDGPFRDLSGDPALLAGTWTWERTTVCPIEAGDCSETTPNSAGRAETLTVTYTPETSSHNGTVSGFFNGQTLAPTPYFIGPTLAVDYVDHGETHYSLAFREGAGDFRYGVSQDRLALSTYTAADLETTTTYRRQR